MDEAPQNLKNVAIIQLVSGLVNMFVMTAVSYFALSFVGGLVTGICTLGLFPIGILCGFLGCMLFPVGIFEVVSGIMGLTNPSGAGQIMKIAAMVEMVSILFGGLGSLIAGGISMKMLGDPEVIAFLESY